MDESAFQTFLKESNLMELWGSPLLFPRDGYEIEVRTLKSEYDTLALHLHLRRACLLKELDAGRFTGDEEKDFYQARLFEEISSAFATLLQNTTIALQEAKKKHQR